MTCKSLKPFYTYIAIVYNFILTLTLTWGSVNVFQIHFIQCCLNVLGAYNCTYYKPDYNYLQFTFISIGCIPKVIGVLNKLTIGHFDWPFTKIYNSWESL